MANDPLRQEIAAEVRAEMARQHKSIRQLAAALGIDPTSCWKRWRGEQAFRAEELVMTAAYLGVPVSQFMPTPTPEGAVA